MMTTHLLRTMTTFTVALSLVVVMLGAYTRLTHAGLGCPDWPGCYGRMVVSTLHHELTEAQGRFPDVPIETRKAWTEMVHRYAAGTLAMLIVLINLGVWRLNREKRLISATAPRLLLGFVVFQALLGMWTVTLKLLPLVVMGHLLGGILIFSTLSYFRMQLADRVSVSITDGHWRHWITLGVVLILCQIALGGWVSANYAGVACIGFPRCNGHWWPSMDGVHGFNFLLSVGANYQGGVLDSDARVAIQFVHRLGAVLVASYVLLLSSVIGFRAQGRTLRWAALGAIILVSTQFMLGIANVVYLLPLPVAVMHNGVAAMLLASFFVMRGLVSRGKCNA